VRDTRQALGLDSSRQASSMAGLQRRDGPSIREAARREGQSRAQSSDWSPRPS
jgi:hypothetical protein